MKVVFCLLTSLALGAGAVAADVTLVPFNSVWKYLDTGTDQGTAWREASFDDASWNSGAGQLGYGDGDETTVVSSIDVDPLTTGKQRNATTYFRKSFNVSSIAALNGATLTLLYDDGGVVFINGVNVAQTSNFPEGDVLFDTYANATKENALQTWSFPASLLHEGVNTVAVEIHQSAATSTDLSFDLQLIGNPGAGVSRGPYLQTVTSTSATVRWRTLGPTDSEVRYGTDPALLSSTVTEATETTEHELILSGLTPQTPYYYSVGTSTEVLAGGTPDFFVVTSPVAGPAQPTRIWAIGDAGTGGDGTNRAESVRNGYLNFAAGRHTDLWLMLGDNAYDAGTDAEHQTAIFNTYPTLLRNTPLWPTIGNHETDQAGTFGNDLPYFNNFTLPTTGQGGGVASGTENYYSFDYANIHFICLDTMKTASRAIGSPMLLWLADDLAATTQKWIIAYFHHPAYTKGSHNSDVESELIQVRQNILPVLEAGGVDLVLNGHSHAYERSALIDGHYGTSTTLLASMKIDAGKGRELVDGAYTKTSLSHAGAVYLVNGCSGKISSWTSGSSALVNPSPHPVMVTSLRRLGSLVLDVDGNRLDAKAIDASGLVDDSFTITKVPLLNAVASAAATESGPTPATVTVSRTGDTTTELTLQATIGGTAQAGSDYTPLTLPVTLHAGERVTLLTIQPLADTLAEGDESVTLTLAPRAGFQLGTSPTANVTIKDLPMDAWRVAAFGALANNPAITGENADPDGDQITNLLEYAYGLNPLLAGVDGLPTLVPGSFLGLSFRRSVSATDLTYTVQVNGELGQPWSPGSTYSSAGSTPVTAATTQVSRTGTGVETIVVRDNTPVAGTAQRFIRLEITRTP